MSKTTFKLNDALDLKALAKHYKEHGWVHIPNFLDPEQAEAVYRSIFDDVKWWYVFMLNGERRWLTGQEYEALPRRQKTEALQSIYAAGRDGHSYFHLAYPMKESRELKWDPEMFLQDYFDYLDGDDFAAFINSITGKKDAKNLSCEATWFRRDYFRTSYTNLDDSEKATVGFLIDFTKDWKADWGGLTHIHDKDGNLEKAIVPSFNSITIMKADVVRSKTYQASYCGEFNLGINGYFQK